MKNIAIIGAGNIGSRHLQALKAVNTCLKIKVVDPNSDSLNLAKERYDSIPASQCEHKVEYFREIDKFEENLDIAIIATHSSIRRKIIEQLLQKIQVKSFILEKILFQNKEDYYIVEDLLKDHKCKAWINCTRRVMPFYKDNIKNWFTEKKIMFLVSGSQWNLISNIIHFVDFLAYILNERNFSVDYKHLNLELVKARIPNFYELNGTIKLYFNEGSIGILNCYPNGNQPVMIDITSDDARCILNEGEGKALVNRSKSSTGWETYESKLLYTSQITTFLVEEILKDNSCPLTEYNESMKLHLQIFEPLLNYLNENLGQKFTYYPFT